MPDSAPTITNRWPANGDTIFPGTPLCFDVLDDVSLTTGGAYVQVWIGTLKQGVSLVGLGVSDYLDPATKEQVHDGSDFVGPFTRSIRIPWGPIAGAGFRFQLRRTGGWLYSPVIQVKALDSLGQESGSGLG